jgi:hypothetical protein
VVEKLLVICIFTLIIHMIDTLSYSVRIAGVRTGKLAVALSLFNIIVIFSRTANMVQAPLTGGLVDAAKKTGDLLVLNGQFQWILASASVGTLLGAFFIPTFISLFSRSISHLEAAGSVPKMMRNMATIHHLHYSTKHVRIPRRRMLAQLRIGGVPKRLFLLNIFATMIYTVGVLATLYASLLNPEHSSIALMSSGLINGMATIILVVFVDPQVALLTEQVMKGARGNAALNKTVSVLVLARFLGTIGAQFLLIPAAYYIAWFSQFFA